ncbi:MAG: tRNA-dihydrouridine synthase family protein [Chitinivibrionia bacterium]|nr:tRNA-dihydrouridine synthase family protein [Chitinivibrionia bacterium]
MELILAPLHGITNATFRRVYHKHFPYFDWAIAPFVSPSAAQSIGKGLLSDLLPVENENSIQIIPQVLLNKADVLYPFLDKIYDFGYRKINVNMGCPATVVVKKNKGAALLERADLIDDILGAIAADKRFEISVKVRLGMTDKRRIYEVLPLIVKHEVDELIIHPRTADMQYTGEANVEAFEEIAEKISSNAVSVIYNGDIFSLAKFNNLSARFGDKIKSVMIGRGALVNPLLTGLIKGEDFANPTQKIYDYLNDLCSQYKSQYYGENPVLGKMKELWTYLRFSFDDSEKYVKKILKSQSLYSYEKHCEELFANSTFDCNKNILGNIQTDE